ncbi:MAG: lipid-A-disaccharide synthase [bacterium]|nr:lipid-A-disaccharide synthase [bacterium]
MKKIFVITGEYSGDIHAGKVIEIIKSQNPDIEVQGIGGENLKSAGATLFCDHSKMSAFGLSLKIILDHLCLENDVCEYILDEYKPDLVLLVDYGAFNLRVAKKLANSGIKVVHYIPPQVWASRKWRINKIKKYVDKVLCIFPFEVDMYKSVGIDVHYCGHPLVCQLPEKADRTAFFEKHGLDTNRPLVSVFPGSRPLELHFFASTFLKSAKRLQKLHPELQFCISHAPNLTDKIFDKYIKDTDFKVIKGENQALLSVSDSLILASGTVALEAALYQTPMIIGYKGPWLLYLIYLLVRCIKNVSLPNIITGKNIVPELIQAKFTIDNITYETERLLYDKPYREQTINALGEVKTLLSDKYSANEAANAIITMLTQDKE